MRIIRSTKHTVHFTLLCISLLSVFTSTVQAKTPLNFSLLLINGEQRQAYFELVQGFEKENPDIDVKITAIPNEKYKRGVEAFLKSSSNTDVVFWFGGARLGQFISQGLVQAIDHLWDQGGWDQRFAAGAQSAVMRDGRYYALPVHTTVWGIYYKKSVFDRLGLKEPQTWDDFLKVCSRLREAGIIPFSVGSKNHWTLAAWFDYLNLRINGVATHRALVEGRLSYRSEKVRSVFEYWAKLLEQPFYLEQHPDLTWRDALPYLYREVAGMMLMGSFWTSQVPKALESDIGMFRFPVVDPSIALAEEAPTDVLFIPKSAKNIAAAEKFIAYMAKQEVQSRLNRMIGMLSPAIGGDAEREELFQQARDILEEAHDATQFYDRDNLSPIATEGLKFFSDFVSDPGAVESVIDGLESLRLESFHDR